MGNPNVGKSVIFGLLTGRYAIVSNYPGTTVELSRGRLRLGGTELEVIDTPGANSLSPNSEDERVARDVLLEPGEKTVVQVADAKNLRRALMLASQLAELGLRQVLVLNMWDEAQDRGLRLDTEALAGALGVPVIPMVATERRGLGELLAAIPAARPAIWRPMYPGPVEHATSEVEALLGPVAGARGIALMLLAGAPLLEHALSVSRGPEFRQSLARIREGLAASLAEPPALMIQRGRAAAADELVGRTVTILRSQAVRSRLLRAAFFFGLAPAIFYAVGWRLASFAFRTISSGEIRLGWLGETGTELATHAAAVLTMLAYSISAWRREYASGQSGAAALARLSSHPVGGFPLLLFTLWVLYRVVGVFGAGDCVDFLEGKVFGKLDPATGRYGGLVNGPLSRALGRLVGTEGLVYAFFFGQHSGLVSKGLTYAIAIVFPIVTLFFASFALLEDSGYLPRLAFLSDRLLKRMGLSGKAVLPMVLGLGCGTMATMTTRILETPRQRLIAILLLALAVPCSAQLGIITVILSGISAAGVVVYVVVVAGMMLGVGWLAAKVLPGPRADFLIEIPPFRAPSPRNVAIKTYYRVKWFMREAVPLFLIGTVCLFVAERTGLLALLEAAARPAVTGLLGLPAESTVGFILGFLRRDYGAVVIFDLFREGRMGAEQALVALVVITLFVPCLAHLFVCVKELGLKKALLLDAFVFVLAFLVGGAVRAFLALTGLQVGG